MPLRNAVTFSGKAPCSSSRSRAIHPAIVSWVARNSVAISASVIDAVVFIGDSLAACRISSE
jgi:hypothetical protein